VQKIPTYVDLDRGDRVGRRAAKRRTPPLLSEFSFAIGPLLPRDRTGLEECIHGLPQGKPVLTLENIKRTIRHGQPGLPRLLSVCGDPDRDLSRRLHEAIASTLGAITQ
jgi:hypothetical protein